MDNNNLITGNPVCVLTGEEFLPKEVITFIQQVQEFFNQQGGTAESPLGIVVLDKKGIKMILVTALAD